MTADTPLLEVRGIEKQYPGVRALKGVDFDVRAGEVHCLLGPNGAGKSTLIKCVSGVVAPTKGEILVEGARLPVGEPSQSMALGVGTIYQELDLVEDLRVVDSIFLGHEPRRFGLLDRAKMRSEATAILERLDHGDIKPDMFVRALRPAAQQVVSIARALSRNVRLLIMDEPSAILDDGEVETLFGVVRRLTADGVGVIYISHRLDEIPRIGDRVTVLSDGRTVATGLPADTPRAELVEKMVGRKVDQLYPARPTPAGDVVLAVRGVSRAPDVYDASFEVRAGEVVARRLGPVGVELGDLAADHLLDEHVARGVGGQAGRDRAPVGEDRDAVAALRDLVEAMGDVDDADALGGEPADDAEQRLHLAVVEDRRRLVHDQQPHLLRQRAGDRDDLLGGGAEREHARVDRDRRVVEALHQRARLALHRGAIEQRAAAQLVAEEDRLVDAQVLDEVELLVDRRDAARERLGRLTGGQRLAVDEHLARRRLDHARDALDERRLAGAVRAEQAVDLAGAHVEVDAVERLRSRVVLREPADLEDRLRRDGRAHRATSATTGAGTSIQRSSRADSSTASVIRAARRPSSKLGSPSGRSPLAIVA